MQHALCLNSPIRLTQSNSERDDIGVVSSSISVYVGCYTWYIGYSLPTPRAQGMLMGNTASTGLPVAASKWKYLHHEQIGNYKVSIQ